MSRRRRRQTLLEVNDLHVYLGQSHILQGVSFDGARRAA